MSARIEQRRAWAQSLIRRGPAAPSYGSAEWLALPEGDARKVAAVVISAEITAREADELETSLRREVEALRSSHLMRESEDYQARAEQHRREWSRLRVVPEQRRGQEPADLYDVGRKHAATFGSGVDRDVSDTPISGSAC